MPKGDLRVIETKNIENPSTTKYLEHKVKQSKEGLIASIAMVTVYRDSTPAHYVVFNADSRPAITLGELSKITHMILCKEVERAQED